MFFNKTLFVAILFKCVLATNMDDLKQKYINILMKCAKDFPPTESDIELLKEQQMPDNEVSKCLFACAYKETGMMDDEGKLSVEGVNKLAQLHFADDAERLKQAEEYTEACKHVNDEPVTDGDKGCDRAALIFKCSVEKAAEFDLTL